MTYVLVFSVALLVILLAIWYSCTRSEQTLQNHLDEYEQQKRGK